MTTPPASSRTLCIYEFWAVSRHSPMFHQAVVGGDLRDRPAVRQSTPPSTVDDAARPTDLHCRHARKTDVAVPLPVPATLSQRRNTPPLPCPPETPAARAPCRSGNALGVRPRTFSAPPARFFFISQNGGECPTLPHSAQTRPQDLPSPWPFSLSLPPSLPPMARAVPYSSRSAATPSCRPAPFLCRGEDIRLGDGMHQSLCSLHGCGWPAGSTVLHSTGARHRAAYCDACAYPVARGASAGVRYASVRLWPLTCAYPFSARGHGLYKRVLASRRNRDVSCSYRILLLCAFACFITSPHCIALCRLTTS